MYELSKDHEDFRKVVREFATQAVEPHVAQWDREHHFPADLVPTMGDLGLFGLVVPDEFGGSLEASDGGAFTSLCIAIEELGRVDQSIGITLSAGVGLGINPILTYGSQAQKERFLPDLVAGRTLAGFGLTEPDAGSDAGATRTKAVLDNGEWVVDGAKAFITNSGTPITSVVTVTARTGTDDKGRPEISAIMVPSGTAGFTVEAPYDKLGWNISDTHGLSFSGCRVPEDHLLGQRGHGFRQFLKTLDDGRIAISALALGLITRMREEATAYAKTRTAFGSPIGVNQGVAFPIADLAVMEENSRLLTYRAAWLKDEQESGRRSVAEVKQAAAVAKLYTSEAAVSATRIATQVFGGNGFMEEYPVARFYRDAKILEIGEGTSEVQRMVIAKGLGLPA
ncbi:MAG: acyl-CoA dehydrogenase family protein [Ornithinibacter sp.]